MSPHAISAGRWGDFGGRSRLSLSCPGLTHITQHGMDVGQLRYERGILFLSHLGSSESKIEIRSISDILFLPRVHLLIEARRPAWPPCTTTVAEVYPGIPNPVIDA